MTAGACELAGSRWRDPVPAGQDRGSPGAGAFPALGWMDIGWWSGPGWGGLSVSMEAVYGEGLLAVLTGWGQPRDMIRALFLGDRDLLIS